MENERNRGRERRDGNEGIKRDKTGSTRDGRTDGERKGKKPKGGEGEGDRTGGEGDGGGRGLDKDGRGGRQEQGMPKPMARRRKGKEQRQAQQGGRNREEGRDGGREGGERGRRGGRDGGREVWREGQMAAEGEREATPTTQAHVYNKQPKQVEAKTCGGAQPATPVSKLSSGEVSLSRFPNREASGAIASRTHSSKAPARARR